MEETFITPSRYCTNQAIRKLLKEFCPKRDARVLDVGCGAGYFPFLVENKVKGKYLGVDIRLKESWEENKKVHSGLEVDFLQDNAEELALLDKSFNFVMSFQALEHIEKDAQAFQEMARRVEPGNYLLLTVPSRISRSTIYPLHGKRGYVKKQLMEFGRRNNLEVVEFTPIGGLFSFLLHFAFWTVPFFGPIPISKRLLGRQVSFEPWKYYPAKMVKSGEAIAGAVSRPKLGLEAGYAVVYRKPDDSD